MNKMIKCEIKIMRTISVSRAYANPDTLTIGNVLLVVFTFLSYKCILFSLSAKVINSWGLKWHLATSLFVWINACMWYVYNCCNTPFLHHDSSVEIQYIIVQNSKHAQHFVLRHCCFKMFTNLILSVPTESTITIIAGCTGLWMN